MIKTVINSVSTYHIMSQRTRAPLRETVRSSTLYQKLRSSTLYRLLRPRRIHLVCIGARKTGTSTVAAVFGSAFRSEHEPGLDRIVPTAIRYDRGEMGRDEAIQRLLAHDRRFFLEVESSHPLGAMAGPLCEAWPEARFLVTVREPLSWLRSQYNWEINTGSRLREPWLSHHAYFFPRGRVHPPEEKPLAQRGLRPLSVYLEHYRRRYETIFSEVPPERRLVVQTRALDESLDRIAAFAGVSAGELETAHAKRRSEDHRVLDRLDSAYVEGLVAEVCGEVWANARAEA